MNHVVTIVLLLVLLVLLVLLLVLLPLALGLVSAIHIQPEQIHISLGTNPKQMVVTWVTKYPTEFSLVKYGQNTLNHVAKGHMTNFTDGGEQHRVIYIHRVILDHLIPGKKHYYQCGSTNGWSDKFWFQAIKEGTKWSPRFVIYGDMGSKNARSLPRLRNDVHQKKYDVLLHVGDFAYDLQMNDATVGDQFMRQIEVIAAHLPYMTCVGNHESAYFNVGPVHMIGFSTEFYYFDFAHRHIASQYKWLENDLRVRYGLPGDAKYGLENLFYKYGVDVEFWAHEHSYERLWPIYKLKVYNGSYHHPYTNPKAPVHIITGSAGNIELQDGFGPIKPFSAYRASDYGFTRMTVLNNTHLYMEQVSDDQNGKIIDSMLLIKEIHSPQAWKKKNINVNM